MTPKEKQLYYRKYGKLPLKDEEKVGRIPQKEGKRVKPVVSWEGLAADQMNLLLDMAFSVPTKNRNRSKLWNALKGRLQQEGHWKNKSKK